MPPQSTPPNLDGMTDEQLAQAIYDVPIEGGFVEALWGDGLVVGVPGPVWSIEGGDDAYVAVWMHEAGTFVVHEADEHGEEWETDRLHIAIHVDQIAGLIDALNRAVADVASRTIPPG